MTTTIATVRLQDTDEGILLTAILLLADDARLADVDAIEELADILVLDEASLLDQGSCKTTPTRVSLGSMHENDEWISSTTFLSLSLSLSRSFARSLAV